MATDQIKASSRVRPAPQPSPVPVATAAVASAAVVRARVVAVHEDGLVEVCTTAGATWHCELLDRGGLALDLAAGDRVLVLPGAGHDEPPCVLGRIGRAGAAPTRVRVVAAEELELRCGPASVTLRKDGRAVTRGVDVAAVASRRNRIKGASVEIN